MRRERILIVRGDGVGDALVLTPLVAALRGAGHTLGAVLSTRNADIFAADVFERVHVLERIPWPRHGSTRQSYVRAVAEARAARYDRALIASEEPEAYRFARAASIAKRIGFINGVEKPLKSIWAAAQLTTRRVRPASAPRQAEHEVETLFRLGKGLHGEAMPTRDAARLRRLILPEETPAHGHVVVQLTRKLDALGVSRSALDAALGTLARRFPAVAVAHPSEAAYAREIADACGLHLEITEDVARWKSLVGGASAVVTPDCGAAHLAGMSAIGCIDLFADRSDVAHALQRWYPWASPRAWTIPLTRRVIERLSDHLTDGVAYVQRPSGTPAPV